MYIHLRQNFLKEHTDANKESIGQGVDIWLRKHSSSLGQFGAVWIFRNLGLNPLSDLFT